MTTRRLLLSAFLLVALALIHACQRGSQVNPIREAEGGVMRHIRVSVAPADTSSFQELLRQTSQLAASGNIDLQRLNWVCYRESPTHFWVFAYGDSLDTVSLPRGGVRALVTEVAKEASAGEREALFSMVDNIDVKEEWEIVAQFCDAWTIDNYAPPDYYKPKRFDILLAEFVVRRGSGARFDRALEEWFAFVRNQEYHGSAFVMVTLSGSQRSTFAMLPESHEDGLELFSKSLGEPDRLEFERLNEQIEDTVSDAKFYRAEHIPDLSYPS